MKRAIVTGCCGFVGRHLVPRLKARGYDVIGIDPVHSITHPPLYPERFEEVVARGHLLPPPIEYDLFIHLAAHIQNLDARLRGGIESFRDIELDLAVARFVEQHPPKERFLYMSSCSVDSAHIDPYAASKLFGERLCVALHEMKVPVTILRPFSGYGSDQSLEYPFPAILRRAMSKENPLTVWGSGLQVRDFIHIDDLTEAIMHFLSLRISSAVPIEIGTGFGTSMRRLAELCAEEVGYAPQIFCDTSKPEASPLRVARIVDAQSLGFRCVIDLRSGIRRAIKELSK